MAQTATSSFSDWFDSPPPARVETVGFYLPEERIIVRGAHMVGSVPVWRAYSRAKGEDKYQQLLPELHEGDSTPEIALAPDAGKVFLNRFRSSSVAGGFDWVDILQYDLQSQSSTTAFVFNHNRSWVAQLLAASPDGRLLSCRIGVDSEESGGRSSVAYHIVLIDLASKAVIKEVPLADVFF